jgi:cyclophilin family peptidyl-prolyl cis-trans isomerase
MMRRMAWLGWVAAVAVAAGLAGCSEPKKQAAAQATTQVSMNPPAHKETTVVIETSMGTIKAELWPEKAPKTVANFLTYVNEGAYDGTIFHRVISGFMIQGGGFTPQMRQKSAHEPIVNEAAADVPNQRGTLAMARTSEVNSATAQFFINLADNSFLNHTAETPRGFGYCVFGKVIEGMDVVDKIASVKTGQHGPYGDVPTEPVVIESIRRAK